MYLNLFVVVQKVEVKPQVVVKRIQPPAERPSADEPCIRLPMTVSESLKQALANKMQQLNMADDKADGIVFLFLLLRVKALTSTG